MVAEVKKRNPEWSEILEQAMAPYRKRVETLESGHVVLLEALRLAKTRLEICLGRMRGCGDFHEVSVEEIPAWIEEMETLIGGPPSKPGHIYYGPHPCDVCGKKICRISVEQGGVKFDYPEGIIYPNTNWVQHVCEAEAAIQQAERT